MTVFYTPVLVSDLAEVRTVWLQGARFGLDLFFESFARPERFELPALWFEVAKTIL